MNPHVVIGANSDECICPSLDYAAPEIINKLYVRGVQSTFGAVCVFCAPILILMTDLCHELSAFMYIEVLRGRQILQSHGRQLFVGYIGMEIASVPVQAKPHTDHC
jgi:hypothetical protein